MKPKPKSFVGKMYHNVKVMDSAARASMTTFAERRIGDVLLTWENEALVTQKTLGKNQFDIVYPSISILTEPSVAIVDKTVAKKWQQVVSTGLYQLFIFTTGSRKWRRNTSIVRVMLQF